MDGWIKLHRKLMTGETFAKLTAIQRLIAIYIVLNANHADGTWFDKYKGIEVEIKRGQLITSRSKIVKEWFGNDKDVTEQKVRTCLDKLERIGFLTKQSTNDYTIVTVLNYGVYQCCDESGNQASNQAITKQQPSDNQAITTNKNDKNVKNDKKEKELNNNTFSAYTSNTELIKALESFIEFRKKIKKPMTDRAITLLLGNLDKLANNDADKIAILEQSILNGWQGIFELKGKGGARNATTGQSVENPNAGIDFGF